MKVAAAAVAEVAEIAAEVVVPRDGAHVTDAEKKVTSSETVRMLRKRSRKKRKKKAKLQKRRKVRRLLQSLCHLTS